MTSLAVRAIAEELMDADDLDSTTYTEVVGDLATVNVVTMAARPTLDFLARGTAGVKRFKLLDVGYGDGDMLRRIARWAARRGMEAELVGVDLNPRSEIEDEPHAHLTPSVIHRLRLRSPARSLRQARISPPAPTAEQWAIQDSNLGPLPYQRSALTD